VTRGEPRIRPFDLAPVPVPPACAGLPDRDTESTAQPRTACAGRGVSGFTLRLGVTCTGPWTERRTCPRRWRRLFGAYQVECVRFFFATLTTFPSSASQRAPAVIGATTCLGTSPMQTSRTDQDPCSSGSPRRLPVPDGSGCLPPLRRQVRERIAPFRCPQSASRSRRPQVVPMAGDKVLSRTLQASLADGSGSDFRESRSPLLPVGDPVAPGPDDPSAPTWLGLRGLSQELIAPLYLR